MATLVTMDDTGVISILHTLSLISTDAPMTAEIFYSGIAVEIRSHGHLFVSFSHDEWQYIEHGYKGFVKPAGHVADPHQTMTFLSHILKWATHQGLCEPQVVEDIMKHHFLEDAMKDFPEIKAYVQSIVDVIGRICGLVEDRKKHNFHQDNDTECDCSRCVQK